MANSYALPLDSPLDPPFLRPSQPRHCLNTRWVRQSAGASILATQDVEGVACHKVAEAASWVLLNLAAQPARHRLPIQRWRRPAGYQLFFSPQPARHCLTTKWRRQPAGYHPFLPPSLQGHCLTTKWLRQPAGYQTFLLPSLQGLTGHQVVEAACWVHVKHCST